MNIRIMLEEAEEKNLSPYAQLSKNSKGRDVEVKPCQIRTCFQRDRDRIIHSKAFRRLKHKTQVFLAPEGDHYRTRLTHTLEVSQISRTIARALRLNEDLTEAIALGHDLGHTPFGHIGEEALSEALGHPFCHNKQSLRVVEKIEYEGKGLNLCREVKDGILNHTGETVPATLEGQIVRIADRIAYINHDIDDAIRAGIISDEDLPVELVKLLGHHQSIRINTMAIDMVKHSFDKDRIQMSDEIGTAMDELRNFMFQNVYLSSAAKSENQKAKGVLISLFNYYSKHPNELPSEFKRENEKLEVNICDYLAGMTDRYAVKVFEMLFLPQAWMV
ncbi:MAG: deoxyguanosinetriphosphate triphosphohydrolase [Actinobacteria bacterium]|nr:deoxyguanosinetriphosphate triphosphohydrolase [Actinomycetota bacterium]